MKEIGQAFDEAHLPVLHAFHPFNPSNVPDKPSPTWAERAEIRFKHYGNKIVDILKNIR